MQDTIKKQYTIWGYADSVREIAAGIVSISTPSHGGYILSEERMKEMPEYFRLCSFTKDNHFEEDASWCAVALTWPHLFDSANLVMAMNIFDAHYKSRPEIRDALLKAGKKWERNIA